MFQFMFVITNRVFKSLSNIKIAFRSKNSEKLTKKDTFSTKMLTSAKI